MQKKHKIILIFSVFIIGIFIYTHWSSSFLKKNEPQHVTVTVQTVIQKDVSTYIKTIGTVEASATVNVKSLVDGEVIKVGFKQGQVVRQGQLLFTIDPRFYQIALQQAQANLAKDQAQLTTAQLTLQRYAKLIKTGYVSQQQYDTYKANANALAATVKADQAAIENAQLQLSYTHITAPISGRTGDILVEIGNIVKSAEGATLVSINQINPIEVAFTIPQKYLSLIQAQQAKAPITVTACFGQQQKEQGQLTFINNAIDTTTGTIQLKATFANHDQLLWPGQFVKINLASAFIPSALIVPNSAVQTGQKGTYVYIIRDGKAYYQAVKIGATVKEGTIIEQGIKAGDQVAIDGQFLLTDGTLVKTISKSI